MLGSRNGGTTTDEDPAGGVTAVGGAEPDVAADEPRPVARWAWYTMVAAVAAEFVLGLATLVLVPAGRPSGLLPHQGRLVYDLHGIAGAVLLVGSVALAVVARRAPRIERGATLVGLGAVLVGAAGGLMAASHPLRLLGIALMFVGTVVAGLAYLAGGLERTPAIGESG
jgi:hypothetical protein